MCHERVAQWGIQAQVQVRVPRRVQGWLDRIAALSGWRHPDGFYA